jgi:hypothetical protein
MEDIKTPERLTLQQAQEKFLKRNDESCKVWCNIDDEGQEYPCCEYGYDALGFEKE